MSNPSSNRGFTLIEMIVVIALIAVIAAVVAPNLLGKASEANRKSALVQLEKIANAIELYRLETGRYPEDLVDLVEQPQGVERWKGPYVRKKSQLQDPWGNELVLKMPGEHGAFDVISYGGDGRAGGEGDAADITNWD
ncbi:MAG: type II secretion system major pseudopilin GspG [Gammaproteobacteria bacterium]|nr:type II secretion system major pseudopilin GspG [Gammaproteobacteria bacterium]MCB1925553.1 type II secretion system major pseudopilin GspG [Gammaproteobacteria bacterium]